MLTMRVVSARPESLRSLRALTNRAGNLISPYHRMVLAVVVLGCALALFLGRAVTMGGQASFVVLLFAVLISVGAMAWTFFERRAIVGYLAIEIPTLLLALSTLVLRQRDTEALADNPLDPAGFFRVVCVGAALMLGLASLLTPVAKEHAFAGRTTTRPFRIYMAYVFVVFLGALFSVSPFLTIYRGVELAALVAVVGGATRIAGMHALRRMEHVLYWFFVALVSSAWLGIFLFPGEALRAHSSSPIPYQLGGVLPAVSSNGLGLLGVLLLYWSIGRLLAPQHEYHVRPSVTKLVAFLGFVTLIVAQYRTGYVSALVALVVLLALRGRMTMAAVLVLIAVVASLWGPTIVETAQPVALRGQTVERASELSGRVGWWTASIPIWKKSPIIGRGLLTGTRFEVLSELGRGFTSTIHGTWIEALVGTGLVGISLLAAFLLILWKRSVMEAVRHGGRLVPVLVVAIFTVRTLTGTTFEASGNDTLLILTLAMSLRD